MSYSLVIVESPAKCKKIETYLGAGYKCIASFGHIRELKGLKNINIESNAICHYFFGMIYTDKKWSMLNLHNRFMSITFHLNNSFQII